MNREFEKGVLRLGELHPCYRSASAFVSEFTSDPKFDDVRQAMKSKSASGNRSYEICLKTLERMEGGNPVSDRYLLGLAWFLKEIQENEQ